MVGGEERIDCPEDQIIENEDGKRVCRDSGIVVSEQTITGQPDWRYVDKGVKGLQRASGRVTYTTHHQGTQVEYVRHGRPSVHRRPGKFARSIRFARVLKSDRPLVDMLTRLRRAVEILELPYKAHDTASRLISYHIKRKRPANEREKNALVAAALHRAVMVHNLDTPMSRILEVLDVKEQELWRAKKKMVETGAMYIVRLHPEPHGKRLVNRVFTYIGKICGTLNLPPIVYRASMEFVRTVVENNKSLIGKRPEIIAAASVYLVARLYGYENVTQKVVAEIVGAKESNVRKIYRFLMDNTVVMVVF